MEKELTEVERPALQQVYDEHLQAFKARTVHLMDVAQFSLANHVINKRAESSTVVKTKRKRTSEHGSLSVNDRWDGRTRGTRAQWLGSYSIVDSSVIAMRCPTAH